MTRAHSTISVLLCLLSSTACLPVAPNGARAATTAPRAASAAPSRANLAPVLSEAHLRTSSGVSSGRAAVEALVPVRPKTDTGPFSDLGPSVQVAFPSWLEGVHRDIVRGVDGTHYWVVGGQPMAFAPPVANAIQVLDWADADSDGDGVPNLVDLLVGAKKTVLNAADYDATYMDIAFPGGDVPRTIGVCTDVVVRSARNAGEDLQTTLNTDIARAPRAYPMVKSANANIDHRRVKTLLPYFKRHWSSRPTSPSTDRGNPMEDWLPGDLLFMQVQGDARPDHVGLLGDLLGPSGQPTVINNLTWGYKTTEVDMLPWSELTHRFRMKPGAFTVAVEHRGLEGVLLRTGLEVPGDARQVVLVAGRGWDSPAGTLYRFEKTGKAWTQVGRPMPAWFGSGLAPGLGLLRSESGAFGPRGAKKEGDRRSPAGVFRLGQGFGTLDRPRRSSWSWKRVTSGNVWVDDPKSPRYNTWSTASENDPWQSAEDLTMYRRAVHVEHNAAALPGMGSAIFLHETTEPEGPTIGCTAISRKNLDTVIAWLRPDALPVIVQAPANVF